MIRFPLKLAENDDVGETVNKCTKKGIFPETVVLASLQKIKLIKNPINLKKKKKKKN